MDILTGMDIQVEFVDYEFQVVEKVKVESMVKAVFVFKTGVEALEIL